MRSQAFVDFVRVHVKAGDGGDGAIAFRREKYAPEGGPAGGHGGTGGSIYLEGDEDLVTLLDLKMRPFIKAKRGEHGQGSNKAGRSADDVVVKVPLGTTVVDSETGEEIGEVVRPEQRLRVARGGRGGRGNESFATPRRRTPRKAETGEPGEERNLILELKTIADVGLVGLPNAGKSTLLAHLTNAHPKIANYPFTTIHPNLGMLPSEDLSRLATLADIPGLIEGAHSGAGLGARFLRHIERTKVIAHLVSPDEGLSGVESPEEVALLAEDLLEQYGLVRAELDQYSSALNQKPSVVCLNKIDLLPEGAIKRIEEAFAGHGVDLLPISAEQNVNLDRLRQRIFELLDEAKEEDKETGDEPARKLSAESGTDASSSRSFDSSTSSPEADPTP